ncbi:single-stranded DNA-binding protein [Weissella paramesenteroides]|uniref:single-stranded DNA-binding protein n=1 Tax=Weissella paramesenteroides TaxID=1249 RepID=UPI00123A4CF2|nr:single-stranded DNA-binding protein [Weissella paramesenteroides]KAA8445021.1 single-stranded DNA-binding protein [Weissella paramesenteroides]KAA8452643.1 single-stranded DNA-binding protein [Weissella paramesenteroides]
MINNVTLTGRLTKDMELKYTTSGTAVASATVAVERSFTDGNGERGSDFINFVIWRKAAENLAKMTAKGSLIGLEGRLQTRSYDNQQGQKVFVTEVVVNNFSLLESKEVTDQRKQGGTSQPQQNNFNQQPQRQNNFNQQQAPQGNFNQQRQQPQQNNFGGSQGYGNDNNFEDQLPF